MQLMECFRRMTDFLDVHHLEAVGQCPDDLSEDTRLEEFASKSNTIQAQVYLLCQGRCWVKLYVMLLHLSFDIFGLMNLFRLAFCLWHKINMFSLLALQQGHQDNPYEKDYGGTKILSHDGMLIASSK